jgi:hypothetical protein
MMYLILLWIVLTAAFLAFAIGSRRDGGALTLSYFLALSLLHVPGALAYADSRYVLLNDQETYLGFQMTLLGMVAFTLGAICVRIMSRRRRLVSNQIAPHNRAYVELLSYQMTITGLVSYFVIMPVAKFLPSSTALVGPLTALLILGLWLQLYLGIVLRNWRRVLVTMMLLPVLPALTTITQGFLGFGIYWCLSVMAFFYVMSYRRKWMIATAPLVVYFGLSLFVTYMRDRVEIRDVMWEEQSAFSDRIDRVIRTVSNFELLDLTNSNHLAALDARLNQNYYIGMAVQRHDEGVLELQYGGTVPVWAFIPRAIWPAKPDVGGGRTIVRDVTGLDLADGTSFGAGQVLEFYVNFGSLGVAVGFFALGMIFRWLDRAIVNSFNTLNVRKMLLCILPGFVLLQPSGNLLEILVSVVAAIITAYAVGTFFGSRKVRSPQFNTVRI